MNAWKSSVASYMKHEAESEDGRRAVQAVAAPRSSLTQAADRSARAYQLAAQAVYTESGAEATKSEAALYQCGRMSVEDLWSKVFVVVMDLASSRQRKLSLPQVRADKDWVLAREKNKEPEEALEPSFYEPQIAAEIAAAEKAAGSIARPRLVRRFFI